eukprot:6458-Heterococcus_DN1.PRE.3
MKLRVVLVSVYCARTEPLSNSSQSASWVLHCSYKHSAGDRHTRKLSVHTKHNSAVVTTHSTAAAAAAGLTVTAVTASATTALVQYWTTTVTTNKLLYRFSATSTTQCTTTAPAAGPPACRASAYLISSGASPGVALALPAPLL